MSSAGSGGAIRWDSPFADDVGFAQVELDQIDMDSVFCDPLAAGELNALGDRPTEARRLEFAAGRAAARQALRGLGVDDTPVLIGDRRQPIWPPGTIGSITHSDGTALAAATWERNWSGVGLDIESLHRYFADLLAMITTEPERAGLNPLLESAPDRTPVAVFAAKEALYKALSPRVGKLFGFDVAHARPGPKPGWLTLELLEDLAPDVRAGMTYPVQTIWRHQLVLASSAIAAA
ncbi:MAG: 4'-phosphopantetheinyl transferase superfamily protein [Acidimicrobiia bacterium]|nr:4'-phosphopantetheinyl transferase superfamily protein [Acidimicrobiia bacterium]